MTTTIRHVTLKSLGGSPPPDPSNGTVTYGITRINNTETVDIGIDNPSFVFS